MMRLTADVGTPDPAPADGPELPDYRIHAVDVPSPGTVTVQGDLVLDGFLRDAVHTLRPIGSDGTSLDPPGIVLQVGDRPRRAPTDADDAFLDDVLTTQADLVRVYLPPDANCLLTVVDRCLRSGDHLNLVVAGKERLPQLSTPGQN
jgi:phosphoketolase